MPASHESTHPAAGEAPPVEAQPARPKPANRPAAPPDPFEALAARRRLLDSTRAHAPHIARARQAEVRRSLHRGSPHGRGRGR